MLWGGQSSERASRRAARASAAGDEARFSADCAILWKISAASGQVRLRFSAFRVSWRAKKSNDLAESRAEARGHAGGFWGGGVVEILCFFRQ